MGFVRSTLIVNAGVDVLTVFPLFVTTVSVLPALSTPAYVITVAPSADPGMEMEPVAPLIVPEDGVGTLTPVTE